jgi:guanine deaminase
MRRNGRSWAWRWTCRSRNGCKPALSPLEARYADLRFAQSMYESLVDGLLANGTTTALYFASIHLPATQKLADICLRRSQRALIGRVAMDNPEQCPDFYRDASAQ